MNNEYIDRELEEKAELLKIIGHPVRLCIVRNLLDGGNRNVSEMQECLCIPQSTVSQHLAKLKSAGIIEGQRNKNQIVYALANEDVKKIIKSMFDIKEEDK
ncbi:ArsR/SmtB family transcription factor [Alkalibacter mobilis]|uniref:ArsR/SmtB family transcription factor n=1 Tax=Alkalibacter mobilis TaxID=2787712 RepID=UPI00189D04A3|nr:metalloregulator ArsR/SmtB family transcription factor [Alkalibacter mobilis]MBF7096683.1 winged helix-turn-helix transcriptional regulator [Alkalibacter mobilis]